MRKRRKTLLAVEQFESKCLLSAGVTVTVNAPGVDLSSLLPPEDVNVNVPGVAGVDVNENPDMRFTGVVTLL
jgi:hypothetical protein